MSFGVLFSDGGRSARTAVLFAVAMAALIAAAVAVFASRPAAAFLNPNLAGQVTKAGQPAPSVQVDLFTTDDDGNRITWLMSTETNVFGKFQFTVVPGCYAVTAIAPDDERFTNNSRWLTTAPVCVSPTGGQSREIDAQLIAVAPGTIAGSVQDPTDADVGGISVDLFRMAGDGSRAEYLDSATTDDDGRFQFTTRPGGCFVVTYIAGAGRTWVDTGTVWKNAPACLTESDALTLTPAVLSSGAPESIELSVAAFQNGVSVGGVQVDLFEAAGDGARGRYLRSVATEADRVARYELAPDIGCIVLTFVAPVDTVFVSTQSPWANRSTCPQPGDRPSFVEELVPSAPRCDNNAEFELILRDDFDGTELADHWLAYFSSGNAGFGLRRPSAVTVADGYLSITASMEDDTLVSGGMEHRYDQTYGKYVFRVRTDADPSRAMSGEVLTWPASGIHPRDGENNIYSTLVQTEERNPFYSFIHKPFGTKRDQEVFTHNADGSRFQIMTMEWTPDRITITREGPGGTQPVERFDLIETEADLIPDVDHGLAIQFDAWRQSIDAPVQMVVDWVEVHRYCG